MIRSAVDRAWRVVFTGSSFLFFFLGGVILSYLVSPLLWVMVRDPARRARSCRRAVARTWVFFHDYMRWTRLLRYDPRRLRLALPAGPYLMIANHPTLVDVTALAAAVPDLAVVAKRAMMRSLLVGPLLRRCQHIDAGDGGTFGGVGLYEQALAHLRAGTPVMLFPEGTRSPERGLGEFRLGAFQIAAQAGVPLVPVLIRCEPPTLMRGQPWYEIPERTAVLTISQLPAIDPGSAPAARLARSTRQLYVEALGLDAAAATPALAPVSAVATGGA
ncbi:MAG TPA: lysophospholipid acyltransferase family protein [Anaeromyxobacter sp.]|nr:lysophospholipid acyltransferase family protein [Anaeromyxobacter sp.]